LKTLQHHQNKQAIFPTAPSGACGGEPTNYTMMYNSFEDVDCDASSFVLEDVGGTSSMDAVVQAETICVLACNSIRRLGTVLLHSRRHLRMRTAIMPTVSVLV